MPTEISKFTTEDIEYLRHEDKPQMLRLLRPYGSGPFGAVIDIHGGAWTSGDLTDGQVRDEALAKAGFVVAALNFRHGSDGYPSSLVDINYGIRWMKAHAGELHTSADRVGLVGNSSGGHLAMLAGMRPKDPRYTAIPMQAPPSTVDATVCCVVMLWPVINPLSRYRYAIREQARANPPTWSSNMKERHDVYWGTEATMAEGNPMLALERGEAVVMPPALWGSGPTRSGA
jgi:acetyl esterase/lipase